MIALAPIDATTQRLALRARGGFLWWYLDLVDRKGNGAVLIWSFGLPFLPGYAQAARDGRAPRAADRPSLNVALYRDWSADFYLLREYDPSEVEWQIGGGSWTFGPNHIETTRRDGRRTVRAELDCAVAGADRRLRGTVELAGSDARIETAGGGNDRPEHAWSPLAAGGSGRVDLQFGEASTYRFRGHGYHDANAGDRPLHELGIEEWYWGRIPLGDRTLIYYALRGADDAEAELFGVTVDDSGRLRTVEDLALHRDRPKRNAGGVPWWKESRLRIGSTSPRRLAIRHRGVVDSGPFYMRFMTEVVDEDDPDTTIGVGTAELIRPERIDLSRHRPLVRMCVDHSNRRNSMWLPLFSGPRRGRFRRLLRYNLPGPLADDTGGAR